MANYQLPNDVARTFHGALGSINNAGAATPNPGATYSAVATPSVVGVVIDNSTGDVTLNATGPNTVGVSIVFSEAGGTDEAAFTWLTDTVDDVKPSSVSFNPLAAVTDVPQPVPAQS